MMYLIDDFAMPEVVQKTAELASLHFGGWVGKE
jgi:hypothetical protein